MAISPMTDPGTRYAQEADLMLSRLAGGEGLTQLCGELQGIVAPYADADIELRGPGEGYDVPIGVELVDCRAVSKNHLRERGITTRKMHLALTHLAPSVLKAEEVQIVDFDARPNYSGSYFLDLLFDGEDAEKRGRERRQVWETLGRLGNFRTASIPWLDNDPVMQLVAIPGKVQLGVSHRKFRNRLERSVRSAIADGLHVDLAPAYDEPAKPR